MRRLIACPAAQPILRFFLALAILATASVSAFAQSGTGTIKGTVKDDEGTPLAYANVVVLGTRWGAMTTNDGTYEIKNVPVGTYTVRVLMIGYEEKETEGVVVETSGTVTVNFNIKDTPVGTLTEVEIVADRERIKTKRTDTSHDIDSKDLESLPVNEIEGGGGAVAGDLEVELARRVAIDDLAHDQAE